MPCSSTLEPLSYTVSSRRILTNFLLFSHNKEKEKTYHMAYLIYYVYYINTFVTIVQPFFKNTMIFHSALLHFALHLV